MNLGKLEAGMLIPWVAKSPIQCETKGHAFWHFTASTSMPYVARTLLCRMACNNGLR